MVETSSLAGARQRKIEAGPHLASASLASADRNMEPP